ncbi:hypothetical protein FACS1894153_4140 [Bacteroidia bacterium]|nr:hypothetical protein FACS1894153_4140 [Bacteroidia bacterium]
MSSKLNMYYPFIIHQINQINNSHKNALSIQQKTFEYLINRGKQTSYGKDFFFQDIKNYNDFTKVVPINDYNSLKPYFDKMINGEQNILWNTPIKMFSKSSGTTDNKSKFIPVSNEALRDCHLNVGQQMFASYFKNNPQTKLLTGMLMSITGSTIKNDSRMTIGDVSALLTKNIQWYVRPFRAPSNDIALLPDWENKIEKICKKYIQKNIVGLVGVPSWGYVLLEHICKYADKSTIIEIWNNFELFVHGGVNFSPYTQSFEKIIGKDINYIETYNASEGFFGFQDEPTEDMLIAVDGGIFYEFIPMENFDADNLGHVNSDVKPICLEDIELYKNYAIVITTNAGLWRYVIGDTVIFTSKNPYRIKVSGRTKSFINAFGEELIEDNALKAINSVCTEMGCTISEFTVAPVYLSEENACHQWLIEFSKEPDNIDIFAKKLDKYLQEINSDYEAKRKGDMILKKLKVLQLKSGTFYEWLKSNNRIGGQNKIPRLCNDRRIADSILLFLSQVK